MNICYMRQIMQNWIGNLQKCSTKQPSSENLLKSMLKNQSINTDTQFLKIFTVLHFFYVETCFQIILLLLKLELLLLFMLNFFAIMLCSKYKQVLCGRFVYCS